MPKPRYQNPKIQQTKSGTFFIRPWVDVLTAAGPIRRKETITLGPPDMGKRKAIARKNEIMAKVNRSEYVLKSQIRLPDFIELYRKEHLDKLSHAQQCKFHWAWKNHIEPAFGQSTLSEITTIVLQEWLSSKKLARSSRLGLRNLISGIFERAIAWNHFTDRNPIIGVKIYGNKDARAKVKLTDEQTRKFMAELPYDVRLLCSTCLFCTLRVSEGLALQEKHLDIERGLILIRQSYYRGVLRETPKTAKGERDIPMGYLVDDLRRICTGDPEKFVFKIKTRPNWGRDVGTCRDDRDLNQHFLRPAAVKLGFYYQGFGFRALRREAITEIGSVAGIGQAMDAAGHSTMDMSLLYTVQDHSKQEQAIKSFQERILGKPEGGVQ